MTRTAVLALGGNALTREGERGTIDEQYQNALTIAKAVRSLIRRGWRIVIVHGNGPQVGNLAVQQAKAADLVPSQPLFALGAMTQGALGSLICLALREVCGDEIGTPVAIVTHIEVDGDDRAFGLPTKPIGPFYSCDEATQLGVEFGWTMIEDSGRGYRRVVASPKPLRSLEGPAISTLIAAGYVVVAAGGGGIPVLRDGVTMRGVDAVIDKDYAAELVADASDASALVMVTGVANVKLDFGTPNERVVFSMTPAEASEHLVDGQFPPGSMGPKIAAAVAFVNGAGPDSGRFAVITTPELVCVTLEGLETAGVARRGTRIEPTHMATIPITQEQVNVA